MAATLVALMAVGCGSDSSDGSEDGDTTGGSAGNGGDGDGDGDGDGGDGDGDGSTAAAGEPFPCDVVDVLSERCMRCHGESPVGGAVQLLDHEDWMADSPFYDPSKKIHEVAKIRINNGEMPQGATLTAEELETLDAWLADGAPAGTEDDASCQEDLLIDVTAGVGGVDGCRGPGAFEPLVARENETCYDFLVHGQTGEDDTSKFTVEAGESYHEFYYSPPWGQDEAWSRFGADFDNLQVLHHFLVFANNNGSKQPGQVDRNVPGTTLGSNSTLISGWAVGGCTTELPDDVAGQIPDSELIMVQWHMYNYTGMPQEDGTAVQICTVPIDARPNLAGITFLGTEALNIPPGEADFTTSCTNNSGGDVTVIGFTPHMHLIGTNMKTELEHEDGTVDTIFDKPFDFDYQVGYLLDEREVVKPGETLITTCSFFNDTGSTVSFGQSTNQEMCYQYAAYYPAGALDKGNFSLIGATNTCW
jgi:hypothetical protein